MKKWLLVLLVVLALTFFGDSNPEQERAKAFVNKYLGEDMSLQEIMKLERLDLRNNHITDISPLKALVNLEVLVLKDNQITDISPLKELVNLRDLHLNGNQITDITPLKRLVKLKKLNLRANPIYNKDIADLKRELPNCFIEEQRGRCVGMLECSQNCG